MSDNSYYSNQNQNMGPLETVNYLLWEIMNKTGNKALLYERKISGRGPRGVMVKMWNRSKRVRTPVALLLSLLHKYHWERIEPP